MFDKCQVYNDTLTVKKRGRLLGVEVVYKILREWGEGLSKTLKDSIAPLWIPKLRLTGLNDSP